jgi:hypothetical protein
MNLAKRGGHQIILTTHSSDLFEALPEQARVLIVRRRTGVDVIPRAPVISAARELSSAVKTNKDLILVEDLVAKSFLTDIMKRFDKTLLQSSSIAPVGNTHDVYRLVQTFRSEGIRAIGVRDPDVGAATAKHIFSLPGDMAPEELLLTSTNIAAAEKYRNGLAEAFALSVVSGLKFAGSKRAKAIFPALADQMDMSVEDLRYVLTLVWLESHSDDAKALLSNIRSAFIH